MFINEFYKLLSFKQQINRQLNYWSMDLGFILRGQIKHFWQILYVLKICLMKSYMTLDS